jgi:hypothetical protein
VKRRDKKGGIVVSFLGQRSIAHKSRKKRPGRRQPVSEEGD